MMTRPALFSAVALALFGLRAIAHAQDPVPGAQSPFVLKTNPRVPSLQVPDDLEIDRLLQEPEIANPLYINFDERGRMWLVEYRQYPWPAGLRLVSRDNVWRNVYEPPFPPPPPHDVQSPFRGADKISIHEDTDGDGTYDSHKTFLDGLNLATAALRGRGGVFVLNPPYLLFYADQNGDDVPDHPTPRILLSGFGIEDTHSIANSLRWGPDGWIYATEGSTVSAAVVHHDADGKVITDIPPVHSMGQNIWRYHPEQHRYEIFAEGGGNAFGVEFDSKGRVYSGHNGGDTRGFHYIQGGYYLKNFGKHGSLSNPYAFGFYGAMQHHAAERFTHTFEIYEATGLPPRYRGLLFGVTPNLHYVIASRIFDNGSSRQTRDVGKVVVPGSAERDNWFTPVDIQTGPDGSLYIADWYSVQANHYLNHEGQTNPDMGRVYRLRGSASAFKPFDLGSLSSIELIDRYLSHENRWFRETALRLLGDRRDASMIPHLRELAFDAANPNALQALWALNLSGGLDEEAATRLLQHPDSFVRAWTIRLLGDRPSVSTSTARDWAELAASETDCAVRLQLACTAKRLPAEQALPIVGQLLKHAEDADDVFIPNMIWWAVEAQAAQRDVVVSWLQNRELWHQPLATAAHLFENLMRRYAMAGTQRDLQVCARLLELAPDDQQSQLLISGFSQAFAGRSIPPLPADLVQALSKTQGRFALQLGVRRNEPAAIERALETIRDPAFADEDRIELLRALSEVQASPEQTVRSTFEILNATPSENLTAAALVALQRFDRDEIAGGILQLYPKLSANAQETARSVLASRAGWARPFVAAVRSGTIPAKSLTGDTIDRLRFHNDPELRAMVEDIFPASKSTDQALDNRIDLIENIVRQGNGRPIEGQKLFHEKVNCGKCHQMFDRGGHVGPDLTSYNRSNLHLMLLAIVNPSAEIREGYQNVSIATLDGQIVTGFIVDENEQLVVLRGADGQDHSIAKDQIDDQRPNRLSLMPENLLDGLTDDQLRDLFAFLSSTTPPY